MTYRNIFHAIRSDAREWWYHAELRRQRRVHEARKLEHRSAKRTISYIRGAKYNGGYVTVAYTGEVSLAIGGPINATVSGLSGGAAYALLRMLPTRRFDRVPLDVACHVAIKGPMVVANVTRVKLADDPCTAGAFDSIRRDDVPQHPIASLVPVTYPE